MNRRSDPNVQKTRAREKCAHKMPNGKWGHDTEEAITLSEYRQTRKRITMSPQNGDPNKENINRFSEYRQTKKEILDHGNATPAIPSTAKSEI